MRLHFLASIPSCFALALILDIPTAEPASANSRFLPVVSVNCSSNVSLCRALVQALAETVPSHVYRINPSPKPSQAFEVKLDLSRDGYARLLWQKAESGPFLSRAGSSSDESLARNLVKASPDLARALTSQSTNKRL